MPITQQHVVRELVDVPQRWRMMFENRQFRLIKFAPSDVSDFSEGRATTPVIIRPQCNRVTGTVEEPQPQIIVAVLA